MTSLPKLWIDAVGEELGILVNTRQKKMSLETTERVFWVMRDSLRVPAKKNSRISIYLQERP